MVFDVSQRIKRGIEISVIYQFLHNDGESNSRKRVIFQICAIKSILPLFSSKKAGFALCFVKKAS